MQEIWSYDYNELFCNYSESHDIDCNIQFHENSDSPCRRPVRTDSMNRGSETSRYQSEPSPTPRRRSTSRSSPPKRDDIKRRPLRTTIKIGGDDDSLISSRGRDEISPVKDRFDKEDLFSAKSRQPEPVKPLPVASLNRAKKVSYSNINLYEWMKKFN